jgi:methionyl-tRNA formyltransferase
MLKTVFFGSPKFSASVLEQIHKNTNENNLQIELVITQPDKPAGRGMQKTQTPVKECALKLGIPVYEFQSQNDDELYDHIGNIKPDVGILFAFDRYISRRILGLFPHGLWNIHPSLLPRYRGPSPIVFPILLGDRATGVTLIKMSAKIDAGDIMAQTEVSIDDDYSTTQIMDLLTALSIQQLQTVVKGFPKIVSTQQDHSFATYTSKIKKQDGYVDRETLSLWLNGQNASIEKVRVIQDYFLNNNSSYTPPEYIEPITLTRMIRAFNPWPGVWTTIQLAGETPQKRLKILSASYDHERDRPVIEEVQIEGKKPMNFKQWNDRMGIFKISDSN